MVLRRAPQVSLHLHADEGVVIAVGGEAHLVGPHALAVLDAFSRPVTFAQAVADLQRRATGVQDWVNLTTTIQELHALGILEEDGATSAPAAVSYGFDDPRIHVKMLNDQPRTSCFIDAIGEVVKPGDVVVDLGTGTGVLAIAAARAGARHVYAIEAAGIGRGARAVFEANGLGDRITLVEGWSSRVVLPEPADVLVTETIGNDPLGEQILEATRDARRRLLGPEPRLVPSRVRVLLLPVSVPADVLADQSFSPAVIDAWRRWYDIDFTPLVGTNPAFAFVKPPLARAWPTFCEPLLVGDLDLSTLEALKISADVEFTATRDGTLDGLVVFFELQLSESVVFSLDPRKLTQESSWRHPVWVLGTPLAVKAGDRFRVSYTYRSWPAERIAIARC